VGLKKKNQCHAKDGYLSIFGAMAKDHANLFRQHNSLLPSLYESKEGFAAMAKDHANLLIRKHNSLSNE
jgi:hypothetical protein